MNLEPRSPRLQADSLPAEPQGKPKNTGVGSLSLLQGNFPTQELNWGLLHCRWILDKLSYQESIFHTLVIDHQKWLYTASSQRQLETYSSLVCQNYHIETKNLGHTNTGLFISSFPPTYSFLPCIIQTLTKYLLVSDTVPGINKVSNLKELGLVKEL